MPNGAASVDNTLLDPGAAYTVGGVDVTFGFDNDDDHVAEEWANIVQVGSPAGGFLNDSLGLADTAAVGFEAQLGDFFLGREVGTTGANFGAFIINYSSPTPVTAASGEIWDIDGPISQNPPNFEQFRVEAYNGNTLLDWVESPQGIGLALDGKPWMFSFSGLSDIEQIRITFIGDKNAVGFAFNNFSPTTVASPVPVPAAVWLFGSALGLLGWMRRKNVKPTA